MKRLLLFFGAIILFNCNTHAQVPQSERDALSALYNATYGDNWTNNTNWNTSNPVSTWFGITTQVVNTIEHVTEILLPDNNLAPSLPPEIGNLPELRRLEIYNTNGPIYGSTSSIPSEICNLTNLEYIDFRGWGLGGELPSLENCMMFNLTWLDLRNNSFTGQIPQEIANIPNLYVFVISNNNFSGPIPDFTNLVNGPLDFFWIENNNFVYADFENEFPVYNASGAFQYSPQQWVGEPTAIVVPIGNTITLEVPTSLGSQMFADWYRANTDGSYTFLGNGLTFDITVNSEADYGNYIYFTSSAIVTGLNLQSQPITIGPDPSTHPDYDALIALYNALDGPNWNPSWDITAPIKSWDNNYVLQFDEITNRLTALNLTNRQGLSGNLPPEIGNLTELITLDMGTNNITGNIPPEIGNLQNLELLSLFICDLSGSIPNEFWTLLNLKTALLGAQQSQQLTLPSGIPPDVSNMQALEWLNLTQVPLELPLQPELFNLPNFLRLRVVGCGLTGTLPSEFAQVFDVLASDNNFSGEIPQEILNSSGNQRLSLTNNFFTFSQLEPLVAANNYQFLDYSPQRTMDETQEINSAPGEDIVLDVNDTNLNRNAQETSMNNIYQWFKDETPIAGATANTYVIENAQVEDSGVYYCEITNTLVPDLIIRRANITINIDESLTIIRNKLKTLNVFPNPTSNLLHIQFKDQVLIGAQIFDLRGRLMLSQDLKYTSATLNISALESGVYLLKVEAKNGSNTKRFIKN